MEKEFIIISNPRSGSGKGSTEWPILESILNKKNINYKVVFTNSKGNAIELSKEYYSKGYKNFIAAGGDGTLNEVANGLIDFQDSEITLGFIPVGTGNDWVRHHGFKSDYNAAIEVIKKNNLKYQDVGKITFHNESENYIYYTLIMLGGGFDAEVSYRVEDDKIKKKSNSLTYYTNILKILFKIKPFDAEYIIDGKNYKEKIFSFAAGVAKFNGKGIKQLPNASTYDGLIDVTLIKNLKRLEMIHCLLGMFNGSFVKHPKVENFQCKKFEIKGYNVPIEVDGQTMYNLPITVESLPKAIKMYVP